MIPHEFLATYPAKLMEYSLGAAYLAMFVPFWRYVQGAARKPRAVKAGWFEVPDDVLLHRAHTWARRNADGLVEIGIDDFGSRLLGPVDDVVLPRPGDTVIQGSQAFAAVELGKSVGLLSPVDGTVVAVNPKAKEFQKDSYGAGWLFKVKPVGFEANAAELLRGDAARKLLDEASLSLAARIPREVGAVLQDGGTPIHGIARELDPERWDELCRAYFRT